MPARQLCCFGDQVKLAELCQATIEIETVYSSLFDGNDRILNFLPVRNIRQRNVQDNRDTAVGAQIAIVGDHPAWNRIFQAEHIHDTRKCINTLSDFKRILPALVWVKNDLHAWGDLLYGLAPRGDIIGKIAFELDASKALLCKTS